jgi:hypothetical protein
MVILMVIIPGMIRPLDLESQKRFVPRFGYHNPLDYLVQHIIVLNLYLPNN